MKVQYVSNERGEVIAVQIPIEAWREIEQKISKAEDWQGVSKEEIASIEAGLQDFEQGRTMTNQSLFEKSRELRKKRA